MGIAYILIAVTLILVFLVLFSLWPSTLLIRRMFEGGLAVKSQRFSQIKDEVLVEVNRSYGSNVYDEYSSKAKKDKNNLIVWVHGGAFVAGDKDDIKEYAIELAYEGYRVINMNYTRAPKLKYPGQIKQIEELILYLKETKKIDSLFLAGDSAGGHMLSQFVIAQTDSNYAKRLGIQQVLSPEQMNGLLLYCAPYDTKLIHGMISQASIIPKFIFKKVSKGYLGKTSLIDNDLNILENVNAKFPPCFITDANVMSFRNHALALAARLDDLGVENQLLLHSDAKIELSHEYQFKLDNDYSLKTFEETVKFLESHR